MDMYSSIPDSEILGAAIENNGQTSPVSIVDKGEDGMIAIKSAGGVTVLYQLHVNDTECDHNNQVPDFFLQPKQIFPTVTAWENRFSGCDQLVRHFDLDEIDRLTEAFAEEGIVICVPELKEIAFHVSWCPDCKLAFGVEIDAVYE